ncbi:D-xylose transport ATP-binding protein XylG [Thermofilum adornatum 1505]|uniref:D-xylose transport ATP-binding protein XylG n=1 Tax=Thermofilum adornatum 1505 TaxID=697581 RepID=A0A3G1A4R0_9CREN|nr:ATP-binding cassette domain-containing protein [Thermofilum adornatum]AJB41582.1 D-xylose transport ATP-binding protein XylG [Thermofilum adornatum 1505]
MSGNMLLEMKGIVKRFGHVEALRGVDFHVEKAEIVGLVGDNGAGKSTLVKIIAGVYQPDAGQMFFEGEPVVFRHPSEARARGIEIVYQHLALIDLLGIDRNIFLGREPLKKIGPFKVLDKEKMEKEAGRILQEIGLKRIRSPQEKVAKLSGGERQSVAIARAMHFKAKLLILDEPTAALSVRETRKVLDHVLDVKKQGVSVILISHNIYHVYEVSDRIVVLDHGRKILDTPKEKVTPEEVIEVIRTGGTVLATQNQAS